MNHPFKALPTALLLPIALNALACGVPKEAGFPDVAKVARKRTGQIVRWRQGGPENAAIDRMVRDLLAQNLTAEDAVQIALLNNRGLQAKYEELGVAQADVVQAGLLENPSLDAAVTFPINGEPPSISAGVSLGFLSLLSLSARKKLAEAQFEQVKLEVGDAVLALAAEVRAAFFSAQGAGQVVEMRQIVADAAQTSFDLAQRQHDAGNLGELGLAMQQSEYEELKLSRARAEGELGAERERLARLLGLWGPQLSFRLTPKLPDLPDHEAPLDRLEQLAIAQRLDVAALRYSTVVLERTLSLARPGRWIGAVELGAALDHDPHEPVRVGPKAGIKLPVFDQGQAAVARLEAERRRAEHTLAARAVEVRSEVRASRDRVLFARSVVEHYRSVVIPLRERVVALTQEQYDAMLMGVYQLIAAKQREADAYREYIEAVRDYWIARSDLERAVGGRLPAPPVQAAPAPAVHLPKSEH